jgi:hypothetical protein
MSDQLADVIRKAEQEWWALFHKGTVAIPDLLAYQADAVRAHLAAVLDAEQARAISAEPPPDPETWAAGMAAARAALGRPT